MAEYIKREAVIDLITRRYENPEICTQEINSIPAADVATVAHGRWEIDADGDWYCTNCYDVVAICESGRERTYRKPYCPNCGAKMDGGDDNETG